MAATIDYSDTNLNCPDCGFHIEIPTIAEYDTQTGYDIRPLNYEVTCSNCGAIFDIGEII